MAKVYPRIVQATRRKSTRPCILCDQPANRRIFVQVSYMRGDDEEAHVCEEHWRSKSKDDHAHTGLAQQIMDKKRTKKARNVCPTCQCPDGDHFDWCSPTDPGFTLKNGSGI